MNVDKLKPCPFCGSADVSVNTTTAHDGERMWHQVECDTCGAQGPMVDDDDGDDAVSQWNRVPRQFDVVRVADMLAPVWMDAP